MIKEYILYSKEEMPLGVFNVEELSKYFGIPVSAMKKRIWKYFSGASKSISVNGHTIYDAGEDDMVVFNKWIKNLENKGLSINTIRVYSSIVKRIIDKDEEDILIDLKNKKTRDGQNVMIIACSSWFDFNKRTEFVNLLRNFKKMPKEERSFSVYPHKKIMDLTNYETEEDIVKKQWKALFRFLYTSGLRVSELNHIDVLDDSKIKVKGKGNKVRTCFYKKDAYTVCSELIGKYTNKTIRIKCKEVLGEKYSPHNLRRSYATYLLKSGSNPKMVQKTMGHSDIKTTYSYFHNTIEELEEEYSKYF